MLNQPIIISENFSEGVDWIQLPDLKLSSGAMFVYPSTDNKMHIAIAV